MNSLDFILARLRAALDELGDACFATYEWLEEGEELRPERIAYNRDGFHAEGQTPFHLS